MLGRIKNRIRRSGSSQDNLSESSARSRTVASPSSAQERRPDFNAKLTDLTSFDACVETCDALAASSGTYLAGATVDKDTGMVDCSVIVSPDGDLLLMMQTQEEKEEQEQVQQVAENGGTINEFSENTTTSMDWRTDNSNSSVVMGNDIQSDAVVNGFSAMGWSAAAASLAIRQTEQTLRTTQVFCLAAQQSQLQAQQQRLVACQALKTTAGIGEYQRQGTFPPTPVPASFKKKVKNAKVNLQSLSDLEPMGSSWKTNFGGKSVDLAPHRVGPLLFSGSTLYGAMIAMEQYYSKIPVPTAEVSQNLSQSAEHTAERAYHRETALKDMQYKANDCEAALQYCKLQADRRWGMVHQAEETVTKIVESRMLERSQARERLRMADLQAQQSEMDKHSVAFATESEIWDIVNAATKSMEDGDFTPLDLPAAPMAGVMDQSGRPEGSGVNAQNGSPPDGRTTPESPSNSMPMASRAEVEQECNLPGLRSAALAADQAVEDAAQTLLNCLSTLDTTRRSARVAGEASLLSACNSQAESLQRMAQVERRSIEERLANLEQLEKVVAEIDVRQDLNMYIRADKKERGGSTWMGEYDDGGIASALAVLSSHVEGSTGMGPGSPTSTWAEEIDEEASPEMLEDAISEIFDTELNGNDDKSNAFEKTIEKLCRIASEKKNKSKRSTLCYALNAKRTSAEMMGGKNFEGLCRVFDAILTGCDHEAGGVANAKMCMMLSQTFYIIDEDNPETPPSNGEPASPSATQRSNRIYVQTKLIAHALWGEDDFWDQALNQCVTESLTHSGVMQNFDRADRRNSNRSEWAQTRKLRWFDLTHAERSEAASQVHAVVFAQLGALAHSMMEFGCGIKRSCSFVRRMSVRNQLPISQRTMLLQHLIGRKPEK